LNSVPAVYVDTSALGRLLVEESDAGTIRLALREFEGRISSRLLRMELTRMGLRRGLPGRAEPLLEEIALVTIDDELLREAEAIEPHRVATLDAIHLATAVRLASDGDIDALMTYDKALAEGARHHGITVVSPA
jgi:predicted nucleic acid-binding protein